MKGVNPIDVIWSQRGAADKLGLELGLIWGRCAELH